MELKAHITRLPSTERRTVAVSVHTLAEQITTLKRARNSIHAGMTGAQAREAVEALMADLERRLPAHMQPAHGHG